MPSLHRAMLVFERGAEDVAVTNLDLTAPDPWPTGGLVSYTGVQDSFADWWTAVKSRWPTSLTFREVRMYREDDGTLPFGEVASVLTVDDDGGSVAGATPPQCACTVTKKVESRRKWGRMYLPGMAVNQLATTGRWDTTAINALASSTQTLFTRLITENLLLPVVNSQQTAGAPMDVSTITGIRIDDVPDVMRSRRFDITLVRVDKVVPLI